MLLVMTSSVSRRYGLDLTFKDIVDDEVSLHDDQEKGDMGPCKLGELESVVSFAQRSDEEDEA